MRGNWYKKCQDYSLLVVDSNVYNCTTLKYEISILYDCNIWFNKTGFYSDGDPGLSTDFRPELAHLSHVAKVYHVYSRRGKESTAWRGGGGKVSYAWGIGDES